MPPLPPRADTCTPSEPPPCVVIRKRAAARGADHDAARRHAVTPVAAATAGERWSCRPQFLRSPPATRMRIPGESDVEGGSGGRRRDRPVARKRREQHAAAADPARTAMPRGAGKRRAATPAPLPPVADSRIPGELAPAVVIRPLPCTSSLAPAPPLWPEFPALGPGPPAPPMTVRLMPACTDWIVPTERIVAEVHVLPGWPAAPGARLLPFP